ncbi:MAG: long-chain fatty acid--CoA ligase [Syntrophales bacterium]|jgi:long-chain acyl-CoA synthetase|nr:long-chain fatty acid--CoA ligase [Syntrophales bacterium]
MESSEKTMNDVFRNRAKKYGERLAVEKKMNGVWQGASWHEYYERARAIGLGLWSLGVRKGEMVSILSENRLEWLYADMGALGIGACVIPIYPTLAAEEIEYIVNNSESKVIIPENRNQLKKVLEIVEQCPRLKKIIVMEETEAHGHPLIISFQTLLELGRKKHAADPNLFEKLSQEVTVDDLATIVYTSGTTGMPKGAMITHGNVFWVVQSLDRILPHFASDRDCTVPFLPLSHVFERIAGHFYGMYCGITASYAQSIDTLLNDFAEKRPTMILAVPRVCEKVYQKIMAQVKEQSPFKQRVFSWGQKVGSRISELREGHTPIPFFLKLQYKLAYAIIFKKLQDKLGGRVTWMTASGAPTAPEIIRFFNAAGITVIQGYGMTETTAPATMQSLADYRIGTTGKPLPGQDIKIAADGEILIKGGNVTKGYWKLPKETCESFTADGYFLSGDIGKFDEEGNLLITDRKKDILITSGGKNVAPQKIEGLFKSDPLFTQFIVIGEKKKYLTGLCNIDLDLAAMIAAEKNIPYQKPVDLLDNALFLAIVKERVEERNAHLARYETIKDYRIIRDDFSQQGGELTATLKLKRRVVIEKYQDLIAEMYEKEAIDELYRVK